MGELLLRKAIVCRDRVARVRRALPSDPAAVLSDGRHGFPFADRALDLPRRAVPPRPG